MSRHDARLAKLEAAMPPPKPVVQESTRGLAFRFDEWKERFDAEDARFNALTPAEKIRDIRAKIAEKVAEAAGPVPPDPPHGIVDLSRRLHACLVHEVAQGFHSQHFAIRGCELEILDAAGYDTRNLRTAHARWHDLPWQWRTEHYPLPKEARSIIDRVLAAESSVHA
jgi:hypothetical protein